MRFQASREQTTGLIQRKSSIQLGWARATLLFIRSKTICYFKPRQLGKRWRRRRIRRVVLYVWNFRGIFWFGPLLNKYVCDIIVTLQVKDRIFVRQSCHILLRKSRISFQVISMKKEPLLNLVLLLCNPNRRNGASKTN